MYVYSSDTDSYNGTTSTKKRTSYKNATTFVLHQTKPLSTSNYLHYLCFCSIIEIYTSTQVCPVFQFY